MPRLKLRTQLSTATCNFHSWEHWLLLQIPKSDKSFISFMFEASVQHQHSYKSLRSLDGKLSVALSMESCGSSSHISCRTFLSSSMFYSLSWKVEFKHIASFMVVQTAEVRQVRRPFIFTDEFTAVGSKPDQCWASSGVWAGAPSSWFLRASVLVGTEDWISFQTRPTWMLNYMMKHCGRILFKLHNLFCYLTSSFNDYSVHT